MKDFENDQASGVSSRSFRAFYSGVKKSQHGSSRTSTPLYVLAGVVFQRSARFIFNIVPWVFKFITNYFVKHPSHTFVIAGLLVSVYILVETGEKLYEGNEVTEIPESTVSKIVESSRFKRNFSPKVLSNYASRKVLRVGAPEWIQRESVKAVLKTARDYKLDLIHQAALLATVDIESGFNPIAKAESTTACGLFQFVKYTGLQYGLSQRDCMNPWLNAQSGVAHYMDNYRDSVAHRVEELSGRERLSKTFEFSYYLHHDGPNSSSPSDELKAIVSEGTPFLFRVHRILEQEEKQKYAVRKSYKEYLLEKANEKFEATSRQLAKRIAPIVEKNQFASMLWRPKSSSSEKTRQGF